MQEELKAKLLSPQAWLRLVFMALYAIVLNVLLWGVWIIAFVQFLFVLFTGQPNGNLAGISGSLTEYIRQIHLFLFYHTEVKPFPFTAWPANTEAPVQAPEPGDAPEPAADDVQK